MTSGHAQWEFPFKKSSAEDSLNKTEMSNLVNFYLILRNDL